MLQRAYPGRLKLPNYASFVYDGRGKAALGDALGILGRGCEAQGIKVLSIVLLIETYECNEYFELVVCGDSSWLELDGKQIPDSHSLIAIKPSIDY
jgi:hypothetical protein